LLVAIAGMHTWAQQKPAAPPVSVAPTCASPRSPPATRWSTTRAAKKNCYEP